MPRLPAQMPPVRPLILQRDPTGKHVIAACPRGRRAGLM
jgi:hypothetical protein